jgi:hypothetical protein
MCSHPNSWIRQVLKTSAQGCVNSHSCRPLGHTPRKQNVCILVITQAKSLMGLAWGKGWLCYLRLPFLFSEGQPETMR